MEGIWEMQFVDDLRENSSESLSIWVEIVP